MLRATSPFDDTVSIALIDVSLVLSLAIVCVFRYPMILGCIPILCGVFIHTGFLYPYCSLRREDNKGGTGWSPTFNRIGWPRPDRLQDHFQTSKRSQKSIVTFWIRILHASSVSCLLILWALFISEVMEQVSDAGNCLMSHFVIS